MKIPLLIPLIFLIFSCNQKYKKETIFEDFETGNFNQWEIQGTAFVEPVFVDTIKYND